MPTGGAKLPELPGGFFALKSWARTLPARLCATGRRGPVSKKLRRNANACPRIARAAVAFMGLRGLRPIMGISLTTFWQSISCNLAAMDTDILKAQKALAKWRSWGMLPMHGTEMLTYLTDSADPPPHLGEGLVLRIRPGSAEVHAYSDAGRRLGKVPPAEYAALGPLPMGGEGMAGRVTTLVPRPGRAGCGRVHVTLFSVQPGPA